MALGSEEGGAPRQDVESSCLGCFTSFWMARGAHPRDEVKGSVAGDTACACWGSRAARPGGQVLCEPAQTAWCY